MVRILWFVSRLESQDLVAKSWRILREKLEEYSPEFRGGARIIVFHPKPSLNAMIYLQFIASFDEKPWHFGISLAEKRKLLIDSATEYRKPLALFWISFDSTLYHSKNISEIDTVVKLMRNKVFSMYRLKWIAKDSIDRKPSILGGSKNTHATEVWKHSFC